MDRTEGVPPPVWAGARNSRPIRKIAASMRTAIAAFLVMARSVAGIIRISITAAPPGQGREDGDVSDFCRESQKRPHFFVPILAPVKKEPHGPDARIIWRAQEARIA